MVAISVGSVAVDVVPSVKNFAKDLRKQLVPQAAALGTEIGKTIGERIAAGIGDPISGPLEESSKKQQSKAPRQGDEVAGAFAKGFQARLRAAFAALPKAEIDADSSAADRKLYELRARLEELSGTTVGVDIDEGAALAELAALKAELDSLQNHESVQVRVDAAAAAAELAAVQAEVDKLDGRTARVNVDADVSGALSGIGVLSIAIGSLAAIPLGATLGAGILSLLGPLAAAGAGFGGLAAVAVPSIGHIKDALKAQQQATTASAAGAVQAQSRALAEAGAQQQLAAAVRNAAFAHRQAADQVRSAEQQLAAAQLAAANAQKALTQARVEARQRLQDLANSVIDAGLAVRQDTLNVDAARAALQRLTSAQQDAMRVQQAQATLSDSLAAQQAVLADPGASDSAKVAAAEHVQQAQAAVKAAQDQAKANEQARKQAQLAYEQAVQQLKEQQLQLQRLQAEQTAAAKAGVEGSNQVIQARQRLTQANQQVANSELALARARQNVTRTDQNSADQLASARRAVTQASLQGASANSKLAASMAALTPAEHGLLRDWIGLRDAFRAWAKELQPDVLPVFGRGLNLVKGILPSLTPIVRGAAGAVNGLLGDVERAARSPFWTQFRTNITNLVPTAITGLGRSVGNVITGMAGIVNAFLPYAPAILGWLQRITGEFSRWGQGLGSSDGFSRFMRYVQQVGPQVSKTIGELATAVGHIVASLAGFGPTAVLGIQGLARAINALSPGEIQAIALAFLAVRGAILANNIATKTASGISKLVLAVRSGGKEGPILARGLVLAGKGIKGVGSAAVTGARNLGTFSKSLATSAGRSAASGFAASARAIRGVGSAAAGGVVALKNLAVQYGRAAVAAAASAVKTVALAVAQYAVRAATAAWAAIQAVLNAVMSANPIGLIIIAITALTAAVIYAYTHWGWFRAAVQATWNAIKVAALFAWNYVLKPIFEAIKFYIVDILVPYYKFLWTIVVTVFKAIGTAALWLWHNAIHPAWTGIKFVIGAAWGGIKLYLTSLQVGFRAVATVARWLWHNVMVPVWNGIKSAISAVWNNGIRPVFNAVKSAIGGVGRAFEAGASAIRTAWNKIKDYTKAPVNFVIGTVYDKGIVGLWNKVMGWLHLPSNLKLGTVPMLASGGELSAAQPIRPMVTNKPTAIVGEGGRHPEYVIPTDPRYRGRAQALWAAAGGDLQMLASGGILGSVIKTVKGAAGEVVSLGKDALDLIANPTKVFDKLAAPILNQAKGLATSPWGQAIAAVPPKLMGEIKSAAKQIVDAFNSGFGGGAGAQGIINAARAELGQGEQPPGSNNTKYGRWFGINPAPWCAMFINYVASKAGVGKLIPHTASAPGMARGFGSRYHSGGSGIQPGDIPFFSNGGGISHVGLAEKVNGSSVGTIEGNHSSWVQRVARTIGQIVGYGRPNYPAGGTAGRAPAGGNTPSSAKTFARGQLAEFHWAPSQMSPLINLWNRESGWRYNARNPSSGAYGIPQALPGSKMRSAGADWRTNGDTQVLWGLGYIKNRYGSPAGAWAHSQRTGWYDQGGWLPPGPSLVYNGTGRPEPVFTGDQFDRLVDGRSGGGAREYHAHFDGLTGAAIEGHVRTAFHAMEVSNGNRERVGRRR